MKNVLTLLHHLLTKGNSEPVEICIWKMLWGLLREKKQQKQSRAEHRAADETAFTGLSHQSQILPSVWWKASWQRGASASLLKGPPPIAAGPSKRPCTITGQAGDGQRVRVDRTSICWTSSLSCYIVSSHVLTPDTFQLHGLQTSSSIIVPVKGNNMFPPLGSFLDSPPSHAYSSWTRLALTGVFV